MKYTAQETAIIVSVVESEAWPLMKRYIHEYGGAGLDLILQSKPEQDELAMSAARVKFGATALLEFFNVMEGLNGRLDSKRTKK